MEEIDSQSLPKWFKKVNDRSWEAELLISGGAAFALFQTTESLVVLFLRTLAFDPGISTILTEFPLISLLALTCGFFAHLILRAFWLAIVMLGRIYPLGINLVKTNLSHPYMDESERFNIFTFAERLDRICSLVFVWTITMTILMIGWALSVTVIMGPGMYVMENDPTFREPVSKIIYFVSMIFMYGFIAFTYLDLFTSGWLRRGRFIPRVYYPIYKFYNALSLGFIWRPVLQTLTSNLKRKTITVLLILLGYFTTATILLLLMGFSLNGIPLDMKDKIQIPVFKASLYRDEQSNGKVSIQSKVVTQNHLEIFMTYDFRWHENDPTIKNPNSIENISIIINDSTYKDHEWIGIEDQKDQSGITTVLPISHLRNRKHMLKVISAGDTTFIPFWKQ